MALALFETAYIHFEVETDNVNCPILNVDTELANDFASNPRMTLEDGIDGAIENEANVMFGTVTF